MDLNRYSVIENKNRREIVLLRGNGCKWRKCRFCDYHFDFSANEEENFILNRDVLLNVTGIYKKLEVINSGSFVDLDKKTIEMIEKVCLEKNINTLHFECHWIHRKSINNFRKYFLRNGINVKIKSGIETFDFLFRESYLDKGIDCDNPQQMAEYFDEVCLLFGIPGQSEKSMIRDIKTGLKYFERVCVNIMQKNRRPVLPDPDVIKIFAENIYPLYIDNERVDILMENTDFGVGGIENVQ